MPPLKPRRFGLARALRSVAALAALGGALCAIAPRALAEDADDQFAIAAGLYDRQQWKLAAEEFQAFLANHPDHAKADQAVFFLAEALLQAGQTKQAGEHFRSYLARAPQGEFARQALFRAGQAAYLVGDASQARTDLQSFVARYPDDALNASALPYLGEIALRQDDAATAERCFRDGLSRFPQGRLQDDCRFGLAEALEQQQKLQEAERFYMAVAGKPTSRLAGDAQFRLGALQYAAGRYAEAIDTFAELETKFAQSRWRPNARLGRGYALLKLGRPDDAMPLLASIADDPKVGMDARLWLGLARKDKGDFAAAADTLLKAAALHPEDALAPAMRFHAGDALLKAGDTEAADAQFDRVISVDDGRNEWADDAMRAKVVAALEASDDAAVDRLSKTFVERFAESPLKSDVQRMQARSLLERKQYDAAAKLLEALASVQASDQKRLEDRYLLALAYEGLKQYERALAALLPVVDSASGLLLADAQLRQATVLMAMGRHADAIKPLEALLGGKPRGDLAVTARGDLAICYARAGQIDEAKALYAALVGEQPKHALLPLITQQLAEAAYDAGQVAWSEELYGRLAPEDRQASSPQALSGLAGLAWSQWKGGHPAEAAETFDRLLQRNPPGPLAAEAAFARGRILDSLDQADPALAMYDLVIDKHPKSPEHADALYAAARLRDRLQQDAEAAALYERLTKEHPDYPKLDAAFYQWAWALKDLGRNEPSEQVFERLRTEHRTSGFALDAAYRLAQAAAERKDYTRAKQLVAEVLSDQSAAALRQYALYLEGQIAVIEQDWPQVRRSFEKLLAEFPESPLRAVAEFWVADTIYRAGQYDEAGKRFDELGRKVQGRGEAWLAMIPLRRAQVLAQQEKWTEAYALASRIESDYPNFEQQYEADYLLGRCLAARADFDGARQAFRKVIDAPAAKGTETEAMARWMMGETFFHQKNYEAAIREYIALEVRCAYPTWQAGALLQAGKCRELLGERAEALKLYSRLLDQYPETPFAEHARRLLQAPPADQARQGET